jgi:hypothetical protein
MTRGPDYAYRLTARQQRTLELLLDTIATGPATDRPLATVDAPPRTRPATSARRRRYRPALAAAAVVSITLVAAFLATLGRLIPPEPAAAPRQLSTADIIRRLRVVPPDQDAPAPSTQDIVVAVPNGPRRNCDALAIELRTSAMVAGATDRPPDLKLELDGIATPAGARTWIGCLATTTARSGTSFPPKPFFTGVIDDTTLTWSGLLKQLNRTGLIPPDLTDPRTIGGRTGVLIDPIDPAVLSTLFDKLTIGQTPRAAAWWTVSAQLLGSLASSPEIRSATLGLAADDPALLTDVRVVTDHPADMLGRAGVTLQVPYLVEGRPTTAQLTFDAGTGALLQRLVWAPAGLTWTATITAYR